MGRTFTLAGTLAGASALALCAAFSAQAAPIAYEFDYEFTGVSLTLDVFASTSQGNNFLLKYEDFGSFGEGDGVNLISAPSINGLIFQNQDRTFTGSVQFDSEAPLTPGPSQVSGFGGNRFTADRLAVDLQLPPGVNRTVTELNPAGFVSNPSVGGLGADPSRSFTFGATQLPSSGAFAFSEAGSNAAAFDFNNANFALDLNDTTRGFLDVSEIFDPTLDFSAAVEPNIDGILIFSPDNYASSGRHVTFNVSPSDINPSNILLSDLTKGFAFGEIDVFGEGCTPVTCLRYDFQGSDEFFQIDRLAFTWGLEYSSTGGQDSIRLTTPVIDSGDGDTPNVNDILADFNDNGDLPTTEIPGVFELPDRQDGDVFFFEGIPVGDDALILDPDVAVGYDYEIVGGDPGIFFADVLVPTVGGDSSYELSVFDGSDFLTAVTLDANTLFDFTALAFDVSRFRITGIDVAEMLDPANPLAFPIAVSFTTALSGMVDITQTALTQFVDDMPVDVPEPAALLLFTGGLIGLGSVRRRLRS